MYIICTCVYLMLLSYYISTHVSLPTNLQKALGSAAETRHGLKILIPEGPRASSAKHLHETISLTPSIEAMYIYIIHIYICMYIYVCIYTHTCR